MRGALSAARLIAFVALFAFATGFALFLNEARGYGPDPLVSAPGAVVLTGGGGRVATGVELLQSGQAGRLLISGVNPGSPPADIAAAAGAPDDLFDCCVDFGLEAANTAGNAIETAAWARERGYGAILVITSDYHMPRALLELRAAAPDLDLIAYGVSAPAPWSSTAQARRWLQEYLKYAAVFARERAAGR
ncbi:YdcF family protein [Alkalicaulis satelles]|uniref:YdcF family protein n=1 Tax=Alkalicaulis satelles TaxID=2609175 RepID=A0A5M6ZGP8_9PROT|nr:YdcF family protein [Alkalicaulis satelles]KAA5803943.1 YdcF family protein [Alkalicaulis satelles]